MMVCFVRLKVPTDLCWWLCNHNARYVCKLTYWNSS